MDRPSYHQPYSHRTRFKVVRSTTKLVKKPKLVSPFKLVQNGHSPSKPMTLTRSKSIEKSSTTVAKIIGNKYKWIRTSLKKNERPRFVRKKIIHLKNFEEDLVSNWIVERFLHRVYEMDVCRNENLVLPYPNVW